MKDKNKTKKKYTQLLTILIANFVLAPFLRGNIGELLLSGIFLYTIIVIVKTFSIRPILFRFFSGIAIAAFLLEIIGRLELYKSVGIGVEPRYGYCWRIQKPHFQTIASF